MRDNTVNMVLEFSRKEGSRVVYVDQMAWSRYPDHPRVATGQTRLLRHWVQVTANESSPASDHKLLIGDVPIVKSPGTDHITKHQLTSGVAKISDFGAPPVDSMDREDSATVLDATQDLSHSYVAG